MRSEKFKIGAMLRWSPDLNDSLMLAVAELNYNMHPGDILIMHDYHSYYDDHIKCITASGIHVTISKFNLESL